ncbi:MAG: FtsX-like permease family protein [Planctomycetes bacterium]|nr:FtsX-like permease family protein [Planctomycetota bacterium]
MYKIILPLRYLVKRRITLLAVSAVALSVFMASVVLTVMHGLVGDFKEKNHQFVGDCVVSTRSLVGFAYYEPFVEQLEAMPQVAAVSAVVKSYGLFTIGDRHSGGVQIVGIDPIRHGRATGFAAGIHYHAGDPASLFEPGYDPNLPGCVFGIDRIFRKDDDGAYQYDPCVPHVGFDITCFPLTAKGALRGLGSVSSKRFYLSDVSWSGLARVDDHYVYLPRAEAQTLCGMGGRDKRINAIHVKFSEGVTAAEGTELVRKLWTDYRENRSGASLAFLMDKVTVSDWKRHRRASIAGMEKEETAMIILFLLVGITTVFIVFVVFYMIVTHKVKDIGILKSMGASNMDIMALFGGFACLVGLCGAALGLLGGWQFLRQINALEDWLNDHIGFQVWDRSMFAIGDIPHDIEPAVMGAIGISAIFACLFGALLPTWQAARLRPIETLQVNQI